jgi:uncharacterized membrane protein YkvA (DUF1232 family)
MARRGRFDISILGRLKKLPAYMTDSGVAWWKKAGIVLGLLYVISPLDAVPDWFPIVGWLDDIGLLGIMYMFMMRELSEYIALREVPTDRVGGAQGPALR